MGILEAIKKKRERILIIGHTGHGKTYTATRVAYELAKSGKKVLYIDTEMGAIDEFSTLEITDDIDKNIAYVKVDNFIDLKKYATNYTDKVHTIIIDPIRLTSLSRTTAKELFIKKGVRYVGESIIPIEDPDTFHLRGFDYQLPNEWTNELLLKIGSGVCNYVVTELIPVKLSSEIKIPKKGGSVSIEHLFMQEGNIPRKLAEYYDLFGYFDRVILMERRNNEHFGIILKWRGKNIQGRRVDNVHEIIVKRLLGDGK